MCPTKRSSIIVVVTVLLSFAGIQKSVPALTSAGPSKQGPTLTATISGKVTDTAGRPLVGANVSIKNTNIGTATDLSGRYKLTVTSAALIGRSVSIECSFIGYETKTETQVLRPENITLDFALETAAVEMDALTVVRESREMPQSPISLSLAVPRLAKSRAEMSYRPVMPDIIIPPVEHNTEEYDQITDNLFLSPLVNPLSTFSIDVDAASYANVRRFLNEGQLPYKDAVRIEELINYFSYDYEDPRGDHPFSVTTEVSQAPWNPQHALVHIGLQGKKLDYEALRPSNLVFLVDVSGSMKAANKLPLLKSAFKLLVNNLDARDRIALVTYAGAAGLVLPSTPAKKKSAILAALENLEAGGSTAGGAGIALAYKVAREHFIEGGNNRVILATDGDFNVGVSSTSELVRTIEEKRKDGIFLTICGFGIGNYKDGRMESISNAGNGNYFYIDNIMEANKVFVKEMRATLFTIAKDVKIQIEFNPSKVEAYRLIGYENRMLQSEDFNDDKKDAGELGAGHTVTALYEVIPAGVESEFVKPVDDLKYQRSRSTDRAVSDELMTVKLRYKKPDEDTSRLLTTVIHDDPFAIERSSNDFRFSASVAQFGMLLRDSEYKGESSFASVLELAKSAKGRDEEGYREEFIRLVKKAELLTTATN